MAFREAWQRDGSSASIALGFAVVAWDAGFRADAEEALRQAIRIHPASPDLSLALARMLCSAGRSAEARVLAERAIAQNASAAPALMTLARCDRDEGRHDAAEARLRAAIALDGDNPHAWEHLSAALAAQGRVDAALEALVRAADLAAAGDVPLDTTLAHAELLRRRGDFAAETDLLIAALRQRPSRAGHFMLAEALIVQGRYRPGWRQFEFRKFEPAMLSERPRYDCPSWSGQDLEGKSILVEAEQGIGDVIWFARYLPLLQRLGARVIFLPRMDMMRVSRRLPGIDHVLSDGEVLPAFDFHVKLMSLAGAFGTTLASIPQSVPYLVPDPAFAEKWARKLPSDGRPRVGIVWAGRPDQPRDRFRSLHLAQVLPILRTPGIRFYSLQKGTAESQLVEWPPEVEITRLGDAFDDLEDLVAAIGQMDLVLSVCTGPAHIAGAMGKPVWTMISDPPDMRWLVAREDAPWYPTMRLFRQPAPGAWDDVIDRVARELALGPAAWKDRLATHAPGTAEPLAIASPGDADDEIDAGLGRVAESRHGVVMFDPGEPFVARSIEYYGEWLPAELGLALQLLRAGDVVIEGGAGSGAHAVPMGRALGPQGQLYLYEQRPAIRSMLAENLAAHGIGIGMLMTRRLGGHPAEGFSAEHETIDDLQLDRLDGIKLDAAIDGSSMLEGAEQTLWRCRPWLLLACDDDASLHHLAQRVREFSYRTWRMETPLFSPDNFNRRDDDVFNGRTALALVALPEEKDLREPLAGCVELR
ncbi:MAG: tetratricopeptide repeat protein [Betaproteobacteria bacterium]